MTNLTQPIKNADKNKLFYTIIVLVFAILACVAWLAYSGKCIFVSSSEPIWSEMSETDALKTKQEAMISNKIKSILENIIGKDKVKVEVNLEINYDKTIINEEIFDPNNKVIKSRYSEPTESNSSESVQYEVNKLTKNKIRSGGDIQKISTVILIDGTYEKNQNGDVIYHPRSSTELEQLYQYIEPVIGYNPMRGDIIKIEAVRFINSNNFLSHFKNEIIEIGILILIVLLSLILLTKKQKVEEETLGESIRSSSNNINKIHDIIDNNPSQIVEILREWLNDSDEEK